MTKNRSFLMALALLVFASLFASCASSSVNHRHGEGVATKKNGGPPPHAPAHGYRHKHRTDGVELAFESVSGVYIVIGFPRHYYLDERYFRIRTGTWQVSTSIDGAWKTIGMTDVPLGVVSAVSAEGKAKNGKKGAKSRY